MKQLTKVVFCSLGVLLRLDFCLTTSFLRPTSPGQLLQMFSDISISTGVFPDGQNNQTMLLVNDPLDSCIGSENKYHRQESGQVIIRKKCAIHNSTSSVLLRHAGNGYVSIYLHSSGPCIGAGASVGSLVYSGNSDWCSSASHQFAMIVRYGIVKFVNHESDLCLSTSAEEALIMNTCTDSDPYQNWRICANWQHEDHCWPSSRPSFVAHSEKNTINEA